MDELMFLEIGSDGWWDRMEGKPCHPVMEKAAPGWREDDWLPEEEQ